MKLGVLIIFLNINLILGSALPIFNWQESNQFAISPTGQNRKQQFEILKEELTNLEKTEKDFERDLKQDQAKVNKNISLTQESLKDSTIYRDYLVKKISFLNDTKQALIDTQLTRKQLSSIIEQHIDLLEEYFKDPTFKLFRIVVKASYGYEEIIELYRKIANQEELKNRLLEEKKTSENELEAKKKNILEISNTIKQKEKVQKEFSVNDFNINDNTNISTINSINEDQANLKIKQKADLIDTEKDFLEAQKKLIEYKINKTANKIFYLQSQLWLSDYKLKLLKQDLTVVERSFWVDIKDIEKIQEKNEKNLQQVSKDINLYSEKINSLNEQEEKKRKEFEALAKENNIEINDMNSLIDWSLDMTQFVQEPIVYELGLINNQKLIVDSEIMLTEVQKEFEKMKLNSDNVLLQIITTWFNLNHKKIKTKQQTIDEINNYENEKNELERILNNYKEKSNLANSLITIQTRSLQNIKDKLTFIKNSKEEYTQKYNSEIFKKIINILGRAEGAVNKQIDFNSRIIKTYSQLKSLIQDQLKQINAITIKLNKFSGVLQRSENAVSIRSLQNIWPEIKGFAKDLKTIFLSYISQFELTSIVNILQKKDSWLIILSLLIISLFIGLFYSFLQHIRPRIDNIFLVNKYQNRLLFYLMRALGIILRFSFNNFFSLSSWLIIFTLIKTNWMLNVGFIVFFYIISIFYLCLLVIKLINFFSKYQENNSFLFVSSVFKRRFLFVMGLISCSSIVILLINSTYSAVTAGRSDLTLLLQGILRIIIQLGLLFLIDKEEILSVIPTKNYFGKLVYDLFNKYYFLLLAIIISLMILSDPQIGGWGKLVNFILTGLFLTFILIISFWYLQKYLRSTSYKIFFTSDSEELLKERFNNAKAWYGLFLFIVFVGLIISMIYIGANIWGQTLSFDKIKILLSKEIFYIKTPDPLNPQKTIEQPFNIFSLLIIFLFFFTGLIIAWAFEKFILQRVFAVFFVDPGVQNTISRIARYFIIILFFILGFLKVELGAFIFYLLGIILLGMAWALKEPVNDLISYFTILVERSIKIGDYIELIDNEQKVIGVVRKINLRTVVIRRNNSVSLIVPNSVITKNSLYNWNYVTSFFAFPDMLLTVNYQANPQIVKNIIIKVLEANGNILRRPEPIIRLEDFSANGYTFLIRGFITSNKVLEQWDIASSIRFALAKELTEAGIRICTPSRVITIENNSTEKDRLM